MPFRSRFDWSKLAPQTAPTADPPTDTRGAAVAILVEALQRDSAWSTLKSDADRRTTARRLLGIRWAVRAGRIGEGVL